MNMRMVKHFVTVFVLLALAPAFADNGHSLPMAKPESVGMSSARLERIGERMQWYIDQKLVPGTVTLVARKGKVVHFEARGQRWVEQNQPMKEDAIFRIASMTKPITSVALMMLFEEGKFQLNDPIAKWLPEFTNMQVAVPTEGDPAGVPYKLVPADKPITIEHVLTHTAGFDDRYLGIGTALTQKTDPLRHYLSQHMPARVLPPGKFFAYSNHAFALAGLVVEEVSGECFDNYIAKHIFAPLKMTHSSFGVPEPVPAEIAVPYAHDAFPSRFSKIELDRQ